MFSFLVQMEVPDLGSIFGRDSGTGTRVHGPVPDTGTGWRYPLLMSADQLRQEALALPLDERAALAKDLLLSLDGNRKRNYVPLVNRGGSVP